MHVALRVDHVALLRQVQSLERIEMELIARLKETQLQQQKAVQELERALGDPSSPT